MKKPEVLLLDLGNVVFQLDWTKPVQFLGLEGTRIEKILVNQLQTWGPYDQFERGKITTDEFLKFINQNVDEKIAKESFVTAWQSLIVDYMDGMAALLAELSQILPLYALTNTNPIHYDQILTNYPEMRQFKKIFSSVDSGFRKPEREIFEWVTEELNIKPENILYIDDCVGHVDAAKALGFNADSYAGQSALDLKRLLWKNRISS